LQTIGTTDVLKARDQPHHNRIEGVVACGGMARIYRATYVRSGLVVAIKVPHLKAESDPALFETGTCGGPQERRLFRII